jgi:hypothetical protein
VVLHRAGLLQPLPLLHQFLHQQQHLLLLRAQVVQDKVQHRALKCNLLLPLHLLQQLLMKLAMLFVVVQAEMRLFND